MTVPGARASGVADLDIAVDVRERHPFTFADRQATTRRQPLTAGDYALVVDGLLQATVERKSLPDLVSSLTTGKLRDPQARPGVDLPLPRGCSRRAPRGAGRRPRRARPRGGAAARARTADPCRRTPLGDRAGIVVSDRGRVPAAVMDQYLEARARGKT